MLSVVACANPPPKVFKIPKRLARLRRTIESKRMDTLHKLHDTLKDAAKEEADIVKDFFDKTREMFEEPKKKEGEFDVDEE
ncbi:hypothetical protein EBT31_12710 [bacterium]|jgi:hypothetical protein|nr:hypothetical protein [bacterium]NBX48621.1 hypothetical protein [bacterium]